MCKLLESVRKLTADIRSRLDKAVLSKEHRQGESHLVEHTEDLQKYFDVFGTQLGKSAKLQCTRVGGDT